VALRVVRGDPDRERARRVRVFDARRFTAVQRTSTRNLTAISKFTRLEHHAHDLIWTAIAVVADREGHGGPVVRTRVAVGQDLSNGLPSRVLHASDAGAAGVRVRGRGGRRCGRAGGRGAGGGRGRGTRARRWGRGGGGRGRRAGRCRRGGRRTGGS